MSTDVLLRVICSECYRCMYYPQMAPLNCEHCSQPSRYQIDLIHEHYRNDVYTMVTTNNPRAFDLFCETYIYMDNEWFSEMMQGLIQDISSLRTNHVIGEVQSGRKHKRFVISYAKRIQRWLSQRPELLGEILSYVDEIPENGFMHKWLQQWIPYLPDLEIHFTPQFFKPESHRYSWRQEQQARQSVWSSVGLHWNPSGINKGLLSWQQAHVSPLLIIKELFDMFELAMLMCADRARSVRRYFRQNTFVFMHPQLVNANIEKHRTCDQTYRIYREELQRCLSRPEYPFYWFFELSREECCICMEFNPSSIVVLQGCHHSCCSSCYKRHRQQSSQCWMCRGIIHGQYVISC